ncbi:MAG TPA: ABC transporter permease [Terracidiphilus sp.]|jgi:putative ABC transport system permease protein
MDTMNPTATTLGRDLRYSLRQLLRARVFTLVAILTLCLGIGCNTAIFSVVYAVLIRPLPFAKADRLVFISEHTEKFPTLSASFENYRDWKAQSTSFAEFGAVRPVTMSLTGMGDPEQIPGEMISGDLLHLLGVNVIAGRTISESDDTAGSPAVALLGYGLWQRKFGSASGVVGQTMMLAGKAYTIIGVLPKDYEMLQQRPEAVVAMAPWAATLPDDRSWHPGIYPVARLRDGVTVQAAQAEMSNIAKRLFKQYPNDNIATDAVVKDMHESLISSSRTVLTMLMVAVAFVLLIACSNVANLLLTRASARRREIAIRRSLGATNWAIVRQLMIEGLLLSGLGAVAGVALAYALMPWLVAQAGTGLPPNAHVEINVTVLACTAAISILAGVLFGILPAGQAQTADLRAVLSETDRGTVSRGAKALRNSLVVSEIALALLLLFGAGLFLRTLSRMADVNLGFSDDHLLVADLPFTSQGTAAPGASVNFYENAMQQIGSLPGVSSVGAISFLPVSGDGSMLHFNIHGRPPQNSSEWILANYRAVSAGYREALRIPMAEGRWISDADRENTQAVVVINQAMAKTFFPNEDAVGKRMQVGATPDDTVPWMTIVGVAGNVKQSLVSDSSSEMYIPFRQANAVLPVRQMSVVVRTAYDPHAMAGALTQAVHHVNANQPVVRVRTMEENVAQNFAQPKFRSLLLTIFAGIALLIAAVGVYGVMAYSTLQRTTEMAIRMALGCSTRGIFLIVVKDGLIKIGAGVVIGLALGLVLARSVKSLLFGVSSADSVTLAISVVVIIAAGLIACLIPAARAARVPIVQTIREN